MTMAKWYKAALDFESSVGELTSAFGPYYVEAFMSANTLCTFLRAHAPYRGPWEPDGHEWTLHGAPVTIDESMPHGMAKVHLNGEPPFSGDCVDISAWQLKRA